MYAGFVKCSRQPIHFSGDDFTTGLSTCEPDHTFATRRAAVIELLGDVGRPATHKFFVQLGQLAADNHFPLRIKLSHLRQGLRQSTGSLKTNNCVCELEQRFKPDPTSYLLRRQKTDKSECVRRQACRAQERDRRAGTGHRLHAVARRCRRTHEPVAGVRDTWRSRVSNEAYLPAGIQQGQDLVTRPLVRVLVVGAELDIEPKRRKKFATVPGVLSKHDINPRQDLAGTPADVTQVSDGCCDNVQRQVESPRLRSRRNSK